jgi:glyceraldehyde 3-phosphate dehydrogenase
MSHKIMKNKKAVNKIRVAVNGLGRIGRVFLRQAWNNPNFEIVALHSRSGLDMYAHLLKYDSTYGVWDKEVLVKNNSLVINGKVFPFVSENNGTLPWKELGVDIVVDATGSYSKKQQALKHIEYGAKYMVATSPMSDADVTLILPLNEKQFNPKKHFIISAGSCTTVCSSLLVKVLETNFGINRAFINTVHAVTSDQSLLDSSHKDLRRARSATESIIPTTTGVSKAITQIYPNLIGKLSAISLRVPAINPSIVSFTVDLKKTVTKEQVNKAFEQASKKELKNHLAVSNLPLVSIDFRGVERGAIVDLLSTDVIDGKMLNVLAWYDNEWGYVSQTVHLVEFLAKKI